MSEDRIEDRIPDYRDLPPAQQSMLNFIERYSQTQGYAPSVREIGLAVGIASTSTVHANLRQMEKLGFLRRDPAKPRAMVVLSTPATESPRDRLPAAPIQGITEHPERSFFDGDYRRLPFIENGRILEVLSAGDQSLGTQTKTAPEAARVWMAPGADLSDGDYFLTEIADDSMLNRQISPGDLVMIRRQTSADNGDMIVGAIQGEILIRTYYKGLRQVRLQAENDASDARMTSHTELDILGVVVGFLHMFA